MFVPPWVRAWVNLSVYVGGNVKGRGGVVKGMSTVWFTSDLHIGHAVVTQIRGFATVIDHDMTLAAAWDEKVGPGDDIWVLGDISSGSASAQRTALDWLSSRPGRKHLVSGNHDGIHPMHRDAAKWVGEYGFVFHYVSSAARRRIDGTEVVLSHFQYDGGDHVQGRYDQWRLRDCKVPVLHGHSHSGDFVSHSGSGTLQIHVGVDAHGFSPVPLERISGILKAEGDGR